MASYPISNLFLLLLSLLPFLPIFSASNVTLGSSLSANGNNSSWISPSVDFAFGFYQLNNTNTFLLAIWYANIPDKTIVWHANTTNPVQAGSKVELTASGLTLNDPNGQTLWTSQPNGTVSYGTMLDTGNFVLSDTKSNFVWESFSYPTDTILPTQILPLGGMLYSKFSETNYSKGRFELHFTNGGNLELNPVAWPSELLYAPYYSSGTANSNSSESGFQLVFSQSADIYIVKGNGGLSDSHHGRTSFKSQTATIAQRWILMVFSGNILTRRLLSVARTGQLFDTSLTIYEFGEEEKAILTDWAYDCYMNGRLDILVENDQAAIEDKVTLSRWISTAIWCIQEDPSKRPTMKMVTQMLEGYVDVPIPTSTSFSYSSS
ncbi:G-type lectin S-receptor-like serine/threonine-protein kinase LECRK3 [Camellia lanceoleosa]|nr:G-type lectin S-receptor-like serine/threonine-protein kinase LECRK3 [Camellia lanceoleosa]